MKKLGEIDMKKYYTIVDAKTGEFITLIDEIHGTFYLPTPTPELWESEEYVHKVIAGYHKDLAHTEYELQIRPVNVELA
jgi:hypothetical protein